MSRIFLIAGLGADTRIFAHLDFTGYEVVEVKWIVPDKTDTLTTYAQKLISQYNISNDAIVIGNSLGGMIGIEIAKIITIEKVILISSIKTVDETPAYFKLFLNVPVYNIIPNKLFKSVDFLTELFFSQMERKDIDLFLDMMKGWSPDFLRWAMGAALHWDNKIIPANTYHITGNKDLVFAYQKIKKAIIIKGGTHIMIYDMAEKINKILKSILQNEIAPVVLS